MSRAQLAKAAELLNRLIPNATPAPWRDGSVDGNRYHALTAVTCVRGCDDYATRLAERYAGDPVPAWVDHHPHEGYGGCLVAESIHADDRRLLAVLRNVADELPGLLQAVAEEDPLEVGLHARRIAAAVIATHTPQEPTT